MQEGKIMISTMSIGENSEVRYIFREEMPTLLEQLPYHLCHKTLFNQNSNGDWVFSFFGKAASYVFNATAIGKTPMEAFTIVKYNILQQLKDWHEVRFSNYLSPKAQLPTSAPRVLIIDDDVDLIAAMRTALSQLGCRTDIATKHEGLHQRIITAKPDYIFLDWKLGGQITADLIVERSVRLINVFSDVKETFRAHKPRIVTYSALKRDQIKLPETSHEFFQHMAHWRKPMSLSDFIKRTSELMRAN